MVTSSELLCTAMLSVLVQRSDGARMRPLIAIACTVGVPTPFAGVLACWVQLSREDQSSAAHVAFCGACCHDLIEAAVPDEAR